MTSRVAACSSCGVATFPCNCVQATAPSLQVRADASPAKTFDQRYDAIDASLARIEKAFDRIRLILDAREAGDAAVEAAKKADDYLNAWREDARDGDRYAVKNWPEGWTFDLAVQALREAGAMSAAATQYDVVSGVWVLAVLRRLLAAGVLALAPQSAAPAAIDQRADADHRQSTRANKMVRYPSPAAVGAPHVLNSFALRDGKR